MFIYDTQTGMLTANVLRAQLAFKDLMIQEVMKFALRIAVCCVLHHYENRDIHRYDACPKNETCAFSERLTHHCTGAGGVGYEKILDWPPWKEPLLTRAWLTTS